MKLTEQEMMTSINRARDNFLFQAGVPLDKIPLHHVGAVRGYALWKTSDE